MAKNYSKEQVLAAIKGSDGIMSVVAAKLGATWPTAAKYVAKWTETQEAHDAQKAKLSRKVFTKYLDAIHSGERWALERVLDTVARQDGFAIVNRTEISGPDGGPIDRIVVEYVDPAKKKKHHDPDG